MDFILDIPLQKKEELDTSCIEGIDPTFGEVDQLVHSNYMYYDRRNGKVLISPKDQEHIISVFRSHGVEGDVFDGYEEKDVWSGEK